MHFQINAQQLVNLERVCAGSVRFFDSKLSAGDELLFFNVEPISKFGQSLYSLEGNMHESIHLDFKA